MDLANIKAVTREDEQELEEVKKLCWEYAQSLEIDLAFQDFETEFRDLPGKH